MKRRDFLKTTAAGAGAAMVPDLLKAAGESQERPNIIFIYTDQQHANMMSCAGNKYVNTPAMDYLAENGMRFTRAYTTNPVCVPARISMMTGRFPSAFRNKYGELVRNNKGGMGHFGGASKEQLQTTLGDFMKDAGYDLYYGGKGHIPNELSPENQGFTIYEKGLKTDLGKASAEVIRERKPGDKPFLMWANFISPHDICYMAFKGYSFASRETPQVKKGFEQAKIVELINRSAQIETGDFLERHCPPLPVNHAPQIGEPEAIYAQIDGTFKGYARDKWGKNDWLLHRWMYARLTEEVDADIQLILDALKESGQDKNTLVIFSSDHGDMDAAHRLEHKTTLYEESANVPFIAMWKGHIPAGVVNKTDLVSTGLDFLPTAADYAGNPNAKADPRGRSLRPIFEGKKVPWRDTLGVESELGWMVTDSQGHKLIEYDRTENIETQLLDLKAEPHEMRHFPRNDDNAKTWDTLEASLDEWFPESHRRTPRNLSKKKPKIKKNGELTPEQKAKKANRERKAAENK